MPTGESDARVVAVVESHDELMATACLRSGNHLIIRGIWPADSDIVHNRVVEEIIVLSNIGNGLRNLAERYVTFLNRTAPPAQSPFLEPP